MTNSKISELIAQSESEISATQTQLDQLQERRDLLCAAETMREAILSHIDRMIEMLNKVSPDQVAIFKTEIDARFEMAEWRSEWDASKIGELVLFEPKPIKVAAITNDLVKTSSKLDKELAEIFGKRVKQYRQFLVIKEEFEAIGIVFGKLITNQDDVKGWRLDWEGFKAGLFWTVGNDWSVEPINIGHELTGMWDEFNLHRQLENNGIDLDAVGEELVD